MLPFAGRHLKDNPAYAPLLTREKVLWKIYSLKAFFFNEKQAIYQM
jgi:hypothetical protein